MNTCYLLIGGNLGDREHNLQRARSEIEDSCGSIAAQSMIYETEPWGVLQQANYLNQALRLHTTLPATGLLAALLKIEEKLGRTRKVRYGPRLIDIDILFFNEEVIRLPQLHVPHPELPNRRFALEPLHEIAPDFFHPQLQKTIKELLADCNDQLIVQKFANR